MVRGENLVVTWARFKRVCEHVCERDGPDAVMQGRTVVFEAQRKFYTSLYKNLGGTHW